jgi:hypothetical protein
MPAVPKPSRGLMEDGEGYMTKTELMDLMDKLVRAQAYKRDKYTCQRCGKRESKKKGVIIQPHHVIGRGNKNLKWDLTNIITLCRDCHCFQKCRPLEFIIWYEDNYPKRWKYLKKNREVFFKTLKGNLEDKLEEIKQGKN